MAALLPTENVRCSTNTFRLLVVEPRSDLRLILKRLLEIDGHHIECVADGVSGVVLAVKENPDVVLTAIDLPGCDGYELARKVRTHLGISPLVIATTSYPKHEISGLLQDAGFDLYLSKPLSVDALRSALEVRNGAIPEEAAKL